MEWPPPPAPESPCVNICELDANQVCRGCGRSLDEIARWGEAQDSERRAIRRMALERLQKKDEK